MLYALVDDDGLVQHTLSFRPCARAGALHPLEAGCDFKKQRLAKKCFDHPPIDANEKPDDIMSAPAQGQGQGTTPSSISGGLKVSSKSPVVLDVQREATVGVNVSL